MGETHQSSLKIKIKSHVTTEFNHDYETMPTG